MMTDDDDDDDEDDDDDGAFDITAMSTKMARTPS